MKVFLIFALMVGVVAYFLEAKEPIHQEIDTEYSSDYVGCDLQKIIEVFEPLAARVQEVRNQVCIYWVKVYDDPLLVFWPFNSSELSGVYIYSHGQGERLDSEGVIERLSDWANDSKGVFIFPLLYGDNWGSNRAIAQLEKLIQISKSNWDKVNLVAYSMGALVVYKYVKLNPGVVDRIIILAGTLPSSLIDERLCSSLQQSEVTVYHGRRDYAVPVDMSRRLKDSCPAVEYIETTDDHIQILDRFVL